MSIPGPFPPQWPQPSRPDPPGRPEWPARPGPGTPAPLPLPPVAPFSLPDTATADLASRLLDQRRVLVTGVLDDDAATRAAAALMWLDANGDEPVELHLSSPDGDLTAALALVDTMGLLGVEVVAYARGSVGGPALGPLCAAGRRRASRLTLFRLQDPSVQFTGDARSIDSYARHHRQALDALHTRIAEATGQTVERVAADFSAGTVLGGAEALDYGILHDLL